MRQLIAVLILALTSTAVYAGDYEDGMAKSKLKKMEGAYNSGTKKNFSRIKKWAIPTVLPESEQLKVIKISLANYCPNSHFNRRNDHECIVYRIFCKEEGKEVMEFLLTEFDSDGLPERTTKYGSKKCRYKGEVVLHGVGVTPGKLNSGNFDSKEFFKK